MLGRERGASAQATGEEYGLRGLVFRVAGSWGADRAPRSSSDRSDRRRLRGVPHRGRPVALPLVLRFAISTGLITWRSGGIEISIVIHSAFNTLGFIFAVGLSTDLSAAIDRSAGDETTALGLVGPSLILIVSPGRSTPPCAA